MKLEQAVRLASEAIDSECKRLAVNANLFEWYNLESCRPVAEKRARLQKAKGILFALMGSPATPKKTK